MNKFEVLDWYLENGFHVIKCSGKAGVGDWPNVTYTKEALVRHLHHTGHTLGNRIRPQDLIIDVDKKAGGLESLIRLESDLGIDLSGHLTVISGRGGRHIYTRLPSEFRGKLRVSHPDYPGVEMKYKGTQVIIPGSVVKDNLHEVPGSTGVYRFRDEDPDKFMPLKDAPRALLDLYRREVHPPANVNEDDIINEAELKSLLDDIPVLEYRDQDAWFSIMAAAYHATNGLGLETFLAWSLGDPKYRGDEHIIRHRWASLASYTGPRRTVATLYHKAKANRCLKAFEEDSAPVDPLEADIASCAQIENEVERDSRANEIAEKHRVGKTAVKAEVKKRRRKPKAASQMSRTDQADEVVEILLDCVGRENLIHAADQNYWMFRGKHWEKMPDNLIERRVLKAVEVFTYGNPEERVDKQLLTRKAFNLLRPTVASGQDFLGRDPQSVVNCSNYELWLDEVTGEVRVQDHAPESFLTASLPVAYDPDAVCPRFDVYLEEVFEPLDDTFEVIRYVWEMLGYAIQPNKNIASWYLFHGKGENGKSVLLDVLSALLGGAALRQDLKNLDGRNQFALADLVGKLAVIDDDVESHHVLNDSLIKKLAETKPLTANPKFGQPFSFTSAATIFLASNTWPRSNDLTVGMRRRANVIPFKRRFSDDEQDKNLKRYLIANELSGILNGALKGLQRLRKRGNYLVPESCKSAVEAWKENANQAQRFVRDFCVEDAGAVTKFKDIMRAYEEWQVARYTRTKPYSYNGLKAAIKDLGFQEKRVDNTAHLVGLRVRPNSEREE